MQETYEPRRAVRAILFAEDEQEVLLIHTLVPDTQTLIWLAPGGGVEPGEDTLSALFREVKEETGMSITQAKGPVWRRRMKFHLHGKAWDQSELFYYVPVQKFKPDSSANPAKNERDIVRGFHWWPMVELMQAKNEIFVPLAFAQHLDRLLREGIPKQPYDVGR